MEFLSGLDGGGVNNLLDPITDVKFFPGGYFYFTSSDGIYRAAFQREN